MSGESGRFGKMGFSWSSSSTCAICAWGFGTIKCGEVFATDTAAGTIEGRGRSGSKAPSADEDAFENAAMAGWEGTRATKLVPGKLVLLLELIPPSSFFPFTLAIMMRCSSLETNT
jgi:hypothetical protein